MPGDPESFLERAFKAGHPRSLDGMVNEVVDDVAKKNFHGDMFELASMRINFKRWSARANFLFFFSLAERAITAVPVTALPLEAIVTSSAMPRFHQAESNNKRKQNKQQPSKTNNATPTRHKPKTKHLSGN